MNTTYSSSRTIAAPAASVWALITTTDDITWRTDLSGIETTPDGYSEMNAQTGWPATYSVTSEVPEVRRELRISHVDGHGTRTFALTPADDGTTIELTETFDFNGGDSIQPLFDEFMETQQGTYLDDLARAAG